METKGVKFLSIKENIDTSTPYGRFTINLLSSLYEMELELIRDRVKDTLKMKKESEVCSLLHLVIIEKMKFG